MIRFNEFYTLKKPIHDPYGSVLPIGTMVRVHDWNDVNVQIVLSGQLVWVSRKYFWSIVGIREG